MSKTTNTERVQRGEVFKRFKRKGDLTGSKLARYLPVMIMTNLSTLLLISVDGLVVGNMVGPNALSSVNIFYPATVFLGVISMLVSNGIATALSLYVGKNDSEGVGRIKAASRMLVIVFAVIIAVIQIPIIVAMIESYGLSEEMKAMTYQYAIGIMISTPFGLISTVGVCQLQIVGKMKLLLMLSALEGGVNLGLDLLFTGPMGMGVAGAGYGTAGANIVRCTLTLIVLLKKTNVYKAPGVKVQSGAVAEILKLGLPEAANGLMLALQNYFMMKIILEVSSESGGVIRGICTFALSLALVMVNGIQGSMRPLTGLLCGAEDWEGLRLLMKQCMIRTIIMVGVFSVFTIAFPGIFYTAHGVKAIPEGGVMALRLMALHFVFKGVDTLFRLYFANRNDARFTTILTIAGNATLPVFALLLSRAGSGGTRLWLSYFLTETIILICNVFRYRKFRRMDALDKRQDMGLFYLSVDPDDAVEASRKLRRYAEANGLNRKVAFRASLCLEEMTAYAVDSQKNDKLMIEIMIRFFEDGGIFMMMDNGRCIALDQEKETQKLITNNYKLLTRIANTVKYQYILDMNYTVFTF